mgnify:FL=1
MQSSRLGSVRGRVFHGEVTRARRCGVCDVEEGEEGEEVKEEEDGSAPEGVAGGPWGR